MRGDFKPVASTALLILAALVLSILSYAGPADSSWVPGLYDDADSDDLRHLLADSNPSAVGVDSVMTRQLRSYVGVPVLRRLVANDHMLVSHLRGPPAASGD
jgi:hypothetical protein